jgi:hypothetical protein
MSLLPIVRALGGDLYAAGRRANIPGPGHSPADRSVSLLLAQGRVVVHCFGEDDWRAVLDDLRRRRLIDADSRPTGVSRSAPSRLVPPPTRIDRQQAVDRIWDLGRRAAGTLGERHIRRRSVRRDLPGPDVLRFIREAPISAYAPRSAARPALALAIRDPGGALVGLELTYLAADGQRAHDLRLSRKTIGQVPRSSAVRLDPLQPRLLVAEGFLTTLSATERFGLPGWALLSTRNLRSWSPPAGIAEVLIAGDRGTDGEASAGRLKARLCAAGVGASIALPPKPWGDWNEWSAEGGCVSAGA